MPTRCWILLYITDSIFVKGDACKRAQLDQNGEREREKERQKRERKVVEALNQMECVIVEKEQSSQ